MLSGTWTRRPLTRHERRHAADWYPDAVRIARSLGAGPDEAAEGLTRAVATFNGRTPFQGWLCRMIRYAALDRMKPEPGFVAAPEGFDPIDPYDAVAEVDQSDAVEVLLSKFGPADRELLQLVALDGLTRAEAGARLGVSPAEVSRRLGLIRDRFAPNRTR